MCGYLVLILSNSLNSGKVATLKVKLHELLKTTIVTYSEIIVVTPLDFLPLF
jgi:hypothetical protein